MDGLKERVNAVEHEIDHEAILMRCYWLLRRGKRGVYYLLNARLLEILSKGKGKALYEALERWFHLEPAEVKYSFAVSTTLADCEAYNFTLKHTECSFVPPKGPTCTKYYCVERLHVAPSAAIDWKCDDTGCHGTASVLRGEVWVYRK